MIEQLPKPDKKREPSLLDYIKKELRDDGEFFHWTMKNPRIAYLLVMDVIGSDVNNLMNKLPWKDSGDVSADMFRDTIDVDD